MKNGLAIIVAAALTVSVSLTPVQAQPPRVPSGKLVIEGAGDSQELLRAIASRFEALHPGTEVDIPDGISSSAAIKAVYDKKFELARVSRPLHGSERHPTLKYNEFAKSPVVFAVHPKVRIDDLSEKQVVAIYSGKVVNWKQLGGAALMIYPLGRESTDPGRMILNEGIAGFADIENLVSKTYYSSSGIVESIARHEGAIGYASMAMVKRTDLKILKVDGVYPMVANVRNGKYGIAMPLGIVHREGISPLAQAFLEFLYSSEAQKIIIRYGSIPVGKAR